MSFISTKEDFMQTFLLAIKIDRTDSELEIKHSLHRSRENAMIALHDYVRGEWDEGLTEQYGDVQILTHEDAVDHYFEAHADSLDTETYEIEELELEAPLLDEHERAAMEFIERIAAFTQDGEIVEDDGEVYRHTLEADDSIDTLRDLIDQARTIIANLKGDTSHAA